MTEEFQIAPLNQVVESPNNPRRHFSEKGMEELTDSVRRHGVLVPLLVRPVNGHFEIIAGARRYRAARAAELASLPVRIKEIGDNEALELQILENLQREDVHPLEEALGYKTLLDRPGYDVAAIAAKVGKSESYVYQRLKLSELIMPAQKAFFEDRITAGHAILIARLQPKDQEKALEVAFDHYLRGPDNKPLVRSVRDLSHWIQQNIHLDLHAAPFSKTDPDPETGAGPCTTCPKRTGFVPQLFPDVAKKDTCTDPACYETKLQAHIARKKAEIEAKGNQIIEVTTEDSYTLRGKEEKRLLSRDKYTTIQKKQDRCESAEKAIVVAGYRDRGQVIDICRDPKCKVHCRHDGYRPDPRALGKQKAEEAKRRRETEIRKRTLIEVLGRVPPILGREDWDLIAASHVREMQNDHVKIVAQNHGWEPPKSQYGGRDWRGAIEKQIPTLATGELMKLMIEISLAGELTIGTWQTIGKPKHLSEISERYDVNVKGIEKAVDGSIAEKKTKKLAKGKNASAATKAGKNRTKQAKAETKRQEPEPSCERCGCTWTSPCPDGCAWSPKFLKRKRYVCTSCEDEMDLQTSAESGR